MIHLSAIHGRKLEEIALLKPPALQQNMILRITWSYFDQSKNGHHHQIRRTEFHPKQYFRMIPTAMNFSL
jgi:hypothetical protein